MKARPGLPAGLLRHTLQRQSQHRQRDMGMDAVGSPVIHRAHPQPGLQAPPRLLQSLQLLVAQCHIRGTETVVIAVDDKLPVQTPGRFYPDLINHRLADFVQAKVAAIATARA